MSYVKFVLIALLFSYGAEAQEPLYDYSFFYNSRMPGSYFFSETKTSPTAHIKNVKGKLPVSNTFFHTPGNSLQLEYNNGAKGNWSAAIYRQQIRGQDHFKKANYLSFW